MLTPEFTELFDHLVNSFVRYHDAPRTAANVRELARRRFDLEAARSAIARERDFVELLAPTAADGRWLAEIGVSL